MTDALRPSGPVETLRAGGSIQGGEDCWPNTDIRRSSVACAAVRYMHGLGPDPSDEQGDRAYEWVKENSRA